MLTFQLLLMLVAANGAPILCKKVLGRRLGWPLDGGYRWSDGRPLFGPSKTWRGVVAATAAGGVFAVALGWPFCWGLIFGAGAMAGDLLSSFLKRRFGVPSSGMAIGLDQIPEALLPLFLLRDALGLELLYIVWLVLSFLIVELLLSRLLFALHIRDHPH